MRCACGLIDLWSGCRGTREAAKNRDLQKCLYSLYLCSPSLAVNYSNILNPTYRVNTKITSVKIIINFIGRFVCGIRNLKTCYSWKTRRDDLLNWEIKEPLNADFRSVEFRSKPNHKLLRVLLGTRITTLAKLRFIWWKLSKAGYESTDAFLSSV